MDMAARTGAWTPSGAPLPYDAEVEYIGGGGNQFVDTGLLVSDAYRVEMKAGFVSEPNSNDVWLMGDWNGYCFLFGYYMGLRVRVGKDTSSCSADVPYTSGAHIFRATDTNTSIDETNGGINWSFLPHNGRNIVIGKSWHVNRTHTERRFWYVKLLDRFGNLVRDFIPVRFTNSLGQTEGTMYDRVSGQLFRNAGTGAFIIGPDKVSQLGGGV